jgi:beta-glucosidase
MTKATIYQDPTQPITNRVQDLLSQMTLDEKIAQIGSAWIYELLSGQMLNQEKLRNRLAQGIGQITRLAGASSLDPTGCAELANELQRYLVEQTRLGIPAMIHEECCSGYTARDATAFPQIIGLASSWQPELAAAMTTAIRQQMRAVGAHQGLSPILDIGRDPRWGRIEETFGEDPYLIARMGSAYIQGLQGDNLQEGVVATVKHFVGYSVTEGGLNWAPAHLAERELHEIYLYPFEVAVKEAKARSLMAGYHELDGIPVSASRWLMTELIRDEWGFDGIVVSDYMSINSLYGYHQFACDKAEASQLSLTAGVDIELPTTDCYGPPLIDAVQSGRIPLSMVDEAVARSLRMKFELGLFEKPYVDVRAAAAIFDTPPQRELAYRIAQQSMVLLKNEQHLLPLRKEIRALAVIGPNADDIRNLLGDYSYAAHIQLLVDFKGQGLSDTPLPADMSDENIFVPMQSVLAAIGAKVSEDTALHYAQGCTVLGDATDGFAAAIAAAQQAEVAIVVVGDKSGLTKDCSTGEFRDRTTLTLPGVQEELVKAIVATGTPTVVVYTNGRPVSSPWIAEHVPAILEAWLPGEEGAPAIADVLFGDLNPGGKLPLTVVRNAGQIPLFYNHKPSGAKSFLYGPYVDCSNEPLYPFGFGLSYTTFAFSDLTLSATELTGSDTLTVSATVTNTGAVAGDEVVQFYTRTLGASVTRPVKELRGFQRITLQPGEAKRVTFHLHLHQTAYYDRTMRFVVESGTLQVMVGNSSVNLPLTGEVVIVGDVVEVGDDKRFVCGSEVTAL